MNDESTPQTTSPSQLIVSLRDEVERQLERLRVQLGSPDLTQLRSNIAAHRRKILELEQSVLVPERVKHCLRVGRAVLDALAAVLDRLLEQKVVEATKEEPRLQESPGDEAPPVQEV